MRRTLVFRALLVAVCATLLSSCYQHYSFEQEKIELSTLGEELWKVWYKDAKRAPENAEQKAAMLEETHNEFVDAVDVIAPEDQLTQIDEFMANLLTLVDDGIVPGLTRKLIVILREAAQDMALLTALASPTGPDVESYVSPDNAPNLLGHITGYPNLVPLLRLQTRIMLENDGFSNDGQPTGAEDAGISDLIRVLAAELREEPAPSEDEPLAVTIRDIALVEDPAYGPPTNPAPAYAVLFDERGYPLPTENADGTLSFPFTDGDADGLADIDANGNFLLQGGDAVSVRPFAFQGDISEPVTRDRFGRAMTPNGPAFQYIDLHRTGLSFLIRQQYRLSQKSALYDTLQAFKVVMGTKTGHRDDIGSYLGYQTDQPLNDMSHALIHMVDSPGLPDFLEGTSELAKSHPHVLARLFWSFDTMIDILNETPGLEMADNQTIVDDLLPLLHELASDQALWSDLMVALRDPIMRRTGDAFGTLISHRDGDSTATPGGPYDACFQTCRENFELGTDRRFDCIRACPMDEIFNEKMDFSAPETPDTISCFQRMQYLLRDAAGKEYAMTIEEAAVDGDPLPPVPPLLVLEDAGAAFLGSVAGNLNLGDNVPQELWDSPLGELLELFGLDSGNVATMVSTLSDLFGAHLDVVPTPDQITRLFNQSDIKFETTEGSTDITLDPADPMCHDGYVMSQHLAYVLYQAEASGSIDTMYPLAKAFSDNDREALLLRMMNVLHDHYATSKTEYKTATGGQSPMKAAGLRVYEPAIKKIFEEAELFEALQEFAVAQHEVEQSTGIPMTEGLRQVLEKATRPGYQNRRGETFVVLNDGRTQANASAFHNLRAAMNEANIRLEADPEAKEKLGDAVGNMAQIMVATTRAEGGLPQFEDPGSIVFTSHLTKYLADRAREKQAAGELSDWLTEDVAGSLEEFWTSRTLAGTVDLADAALADPADVQVLDEFMTYLLGGIPGQTNVLVAVHQLLVQSIQQDSWRPVARFLANVIDPDRTFDVEPYQEFPMVTLGILLLKKTLDADPQNTGIFLIHRGLERPPYGDAPFTIVIDVIARYLSPDPTSETFQTPRDYGQFFTQMSDYMADDVHGMERLYELVDRRVKPAEGLNQPATEDEPATE